MKTKLGIESEYSRKKGMEAVLGLYPGLKSYCCYLTRSQWDGEDLAQEIVAKVFRHYLKPGYKQQEISMALLYRMAKNQWLDHVRKMKREKEESKKSPSYEPFKHFAETSAMIETLLAHLTINQAAIFLLKDIFFFSLSEISEELGISEGAVKSSLFRTRNRLRDILAMEEEGKKNNLNDSSILHSFIESLQLDEPLILLKVLKSHRLKGQSSPFQAPMMNMQAKAA
ncbi:sigma-70 family RNA polymerase sigma factor [Heyndrickxia acidicola]|uniref:Sigma-70 family RNA polymerase sigma factor n=1 Tax=Heyndrickxia acidicola TaxID=209389 RepID=A0ABU6MC58_9BACI|nr:sigma-70 family RNA polymerase sigma factor [Heyndrickxia acidicola]MED1201591.1 sigma-70 family RNA polymerase sigma factor [Heyndrickxia acidicola]